MCKFRRVLGLAAVLAVVCVAGCGPKPQWEILAANQGPVPCKIVLQMGTESNPNTATANLAPGATASLIAGDYDTVLLTFIATRNGQDEVIQVDSKLRVGMRYTITIKPSGEIETLESIR